MIFVVIGLALGIALALAAQPLTFLIGPVDAISAWLVDAGHRLVAGALAAVGMRPGAVGTQVLAAVLAVMLPGLVCLALAVAVKAAVRVRRAAGGALFAAALCSFAVLPAGQALLLCLLAVLVAAVLSVATGPLLVTPVVAVGTVLGARTVAVVLHARSTAVSTGAGTLAHLSGIDPALWRVALTVAALAPVAAALRVLLRGR